jgi:hypothetical protein
LQTLSQKRRESRVLMILVPHTTQAVSEPKGPGTHNGAPFAKGRVESGGSDLGAASRPAPDDGPPFSTVIVDDSARPDRSRHPGQAHGG